MSSPPCQSKYPEASTRFPQMRIIPEINRNRTIPTFLLSPRSCNPPLAPHWLTFLSGTLAHLQLVSVRVLFWGLAQQEVSGRDAQHPGNELRSAAFIGHPRVNRCEDTASIVILQWWSFSGVPRGHFSGVIRQSRSLQELAPARDWCRDL